MARRPITSHPSQTHRTPEVIAAEIAAVDAFEGTKKDAFEAFWERWGHPNVSDPRRTSRGLLKAAAKSRAIAQ